LTKRRGEKEEEEGENDASSYLITCLTYLRASGTNREGKKKERARKRKKKGPPAEDRVHIRSFGLAIREGGKEREKEGKKSGRRRHGSLESPLAISRPD